MAIAQTGLETLRGAVEVTEGVGTAPTRFLYAPVGSVSLEHKVESSEDTRAWAKFEPTADILPEIQDIAFVLDGVQGDYETFGWWLTSLAATGAPIPATVETTAFTREFDPSQTISIVNLTTGVTSLNLEFGTNDFAATRVWKMPGMVCEEITINMRKRASGVDNGVTWGGRWRSATKPTTSATFSGSLTDVARTLILGQQFKAYIDTTEGNLGTTNDKEVVEAEFHFLRPAMFHDGADGTDSHTEMLRPEQWTSEFSYIRKFDSVAEYDLYIGTAFAKTQRALRMEFIGAIVGDTAATNTFQLNFIGKYIDMDAVPLRRDGIWYQEFNLKGTYEATQGASWNIFTQNDVAAAYTAT